MSVELKLKTFTPQEIADAVNGRLEIYGTDAVGNVRIIATDSREAGSGVLFCAIKGQNVDGNDFIPAALDAGSACFLCQFVPEAAKTSGRSFAAMVVEDTVKAIGALAAYYRKFTDAKFIAITGSVGKTTTKEFIFAVASAGFKAHKTQGNYNNELGLPLTIFGIAPDDQVVVLEMGMSALGEIEYMT